MIREKTPVYVLECERCGTVPDPLIRFARRADTAAPNALPTDWCSVTRAENGASSQAHLCPACTYALAYFLTCAADGGEL
jgi:hypothetical protein